jgi:hypothetical protein
MHSDIRYVRLFYPLLTEVTQSQAVVTQFRKGGLCLTARQLSMKDLIH